MLKMNELRQPNSCLNKAEPLEPLFVLRGKDPLAAATVRLWVAMSHQSHSPEKLKEALACAESMEKWVLDISAMQPKCAAPVGQAIYDPLRDTR
jgi:hypothetical protein